MARKLKRSLYTRKGWQSLASICRVEAFLRAQSSDMGVRCPGQGQAHRQECVQSHDILYEMFRDILYTLARA